MRIDLILPPILLTLVLFGLGEFVCRALNLNLPKPQSFYESFLRGFGIYSKSIDRRLIKRFWIARGVVGFVTYLIVTSIFL